jgi:hypothetical protein
MFLDKSDSPFKTSQENLRIGGNRHTINEIGKDKDTSKPPRGKGNPRTSPRADRQFWKPETRYDGEF